MRPTRVFSVINVVVFIAGCFTSSCCVHVGMDEMKRLNLKVIKYSQNTQPVFINLMSKRHPHVTGELHNIQAQPKTMKMCKKRFTRSILGVPKLPLVPFLMPLIPKPPILPLFPNWLPNLTTLDLPDLLNPSPIAKLSRLLGRSQRNAQIHEKLLQMKHKGTLSPTEYIKFTNLLMRL